MGPPATAAKVVVGQVTQRSAKVRTCVQIIVLKELECGAVKIVGAGFEYDVGDGTCGATEFSLEIIRRDIDRFNSFGRRNDDLQKPGPFIVVNAFNLVEISLAGQSVGLSLQ